MSENKSLLKYHLDQLEEGLSFQIVEQSDEVTNYVKRVGVYTASNGYRVTIDKVPAIDPERKAIFLRGRKSHKDLTIASVEGLNSNKEAKKMCDAIDRALQDLCTDVKGGRNRRPFILQDQIIVDMRELDPFAYYCARDPRIIVIR